MNKPKQKEESIKQEETKYTKEQITNSKQYSKYKDLLQSILNDNENYTTEEVDKKIENFMKRRV